MIYALDEAGDYAEATPGAVGYCPGCEERLIPRCGRIYSWHWAHKGEMDCDPWAEHDTPWHLEWKRLVRPEACEVRIGTHRADIVGKNGVVIDLQHASLSVDAIRERERFYARHGGMVWVVHAESFRERIILRDRGTHHSFRWKHPRWSYRYARRPMFWDFCDGTMLHVKKIHDNLPCGGWGYLRSRHQFIDRYLSDVSDSTSERTLGSTVLP